MSAQVEVLMDDPIEMALAESAIALSRKRAKWNAIKAFYRPVINALQLLDIEPTLDMVDVNVHFAGDAHKLAAVVRILRTAGFTTDSPRPKVGDTTWSASYRHPQCSTPVCLGFASTVCKRVKVGTVKVDQDVYETRCGDSDISTVFPAIATDAPTLPAEVPF